MFGNQAIGELLGVGGGGGSGITGPTWAVVLFVIMWVIAAVALGMLLRRRFRRARSPKRGEQQ
jgi:membrane protein implicated in regulation of membrane protease activity